MRNCYKHPHLCPCHLRHVCHTLLLEKHDGKAIYFETEKRVK